MNPAKFHIPDIRLQQTETQARAHKRPCNHCPSANYPPDPESADILTWPHEHRIDTAFACGWAPVRYCRGYCDLMGISDADLKTLQYQRKDQS